MTSSDGGMLEVLRGSGASSRAVVLFPGLGSSAAIWHEVLHRMDDQIPGIDVLSAPAVAEGTASQHGLRSIPSLGSALANELEHAKYEVVVGVAHSLGTFVGLEARRVLGERMRSLIAINGGLATAGQLLDQPGRTFYRHPKTSLAVTSLLAGVCLPIPPRLIDGLRRHPKIASMAFAPFVGRKVAGKPEEREILLSFVGHGELLSALFANRHYWRRIADGMLDGQGVTLMCGTNDPVATPYSSLGFSKAISCPNIIWIEGAHHAIPLEAPLSVVETISSVVNLHT